MVKIIYEGHRNPARIKVGSPILWGKGEIKEIENEFAEKLLKNSEFSLAGKRKEKKREEEKPVKKETPILFNVDIADKDELLDYTALNGIEADYSMTVDELREKIRDN